MDKPDIVKVIEDRGIELKRCGKELRGLCPFHREKTPSFYVNPDKQVFLCRGCQAGGDVFDFVMQIDGCTFKEALKILGVDGKTLPKRSMGVSREARQITAWANSRFSRAQSILRDINQKMRLAQELGWKEEIERLCREYQILETLSDDLATCRTALALYRQSKDWVENLLDDAEEEPPTIFPEASPDYLIRLRAYVGGDA